MLNYDYPIYTVYQRLILAPFTEPTVNPYELVFRLLHSECQVLSKAVSEREISQLPPIAEVVL